MIRPGIYSRLFTPYVFILLIGLGGAWVAATQLFSETLEKSLNSQLTHTVEMLSSGVFPYTPGLLKQLSRLIRADIALINPQGEIAVSTYPGQIQPLQQHFNDLIAHPEATQMSSQRIQASGQHFLLVFAKASQTRDPRVAYIAAFSELSDIREASQRMAQWLGAGAFAGLLLLAWIGHLISRSITRPIKGLAQMASAIAEGNRRIRAKIHRNDEIGELSASLNSMAEELDKYEHEIARQSRMSTLGQMTARIAHEIRNPLTAIKMQLQMLKETSDKQSQSLLDNLIDESRRLELIVLSTLQHKRISAPVLTEANINTLAQELIRLLEPQFKHQGLTIRRALDDNLAPVAMDKDMMTQILLNLLLNAKDELPDGGEILVSSGNLDRHTGVWLAVEDSGPGIPEQDWPTLFTDSTSHKPGGFGLGLRLCYELIDLHHGQISVGHSALGGARFELSIPSGDSQT